MSSVVASKTSYLTHCTFNSCTRHGKFLSLGEGDPPPHTHSPLRVLTSHSRPPCFPFFFYLFPPKVQTPPTPRKRLVVISSHGILLTRKHANRFLSVSHSLATTGEETLPCHTVRSRSITHSHPTINILSAHAHGKGFGTTQKIGTSGESRATQPPHPTGAPPLLT